MLVQNQLLNYLAYFAAAEKGILPTEEIAIMANYCICKLQMRRLWLYPLSHRRGTMCRFATAPHVVFTWEGWGFPPFISELRSPIEFDTSSCISTIQETPKAVFLVYLLEHGGVVPLEHGVPRAYGGGSIHVVDVFTLLGQRFLAVH